MRNHKSLISMILVFLLLIHLGAFAQIPDDMLADLTIAPLSSDYINYISKDNNSGDYIPAPGGMYSSPSQKISLFNIIPASYYLSDQNYVSPIKDQGDLGICWAFSANSSFESNLLMKYNPGIENTYDYSEAHMGYALSKYTDTAGVYNPWGFDRAIDGGGNIQMALAYYSRGTGPVLESNDVYPYPADETNYKNRSYNITQSKPVDRYASDVYILPNDEDSSAHRDKIKQMLMTYGAVSTGFYIDGTYLNNGVSYYYPPTESGSTNHAVSIVGWNDAYSRTNFKTQPAGDGAFLIKNSWGEDWGDGGYFWMSYYDKYAGYDAGCIANSMDVCYNNIYQYDPFGYTYSLGNGSHEAAIANKFTSKSNNEILKAVGFTTVIENVYYYIYVNSENNDLPLNLSSPVTSGELSYAGYHTITLPDAITLNNKDFSVTIYFASADGETPMEIPLEGVTAGYNSQATASQGQGYYYSGGWKDAATTIYNSGTPLPCSLCIKALTDNPPVTDDLDYTISYTDANDDPIHTVSSGTINTTFYATNNTASDANLSGVAALYKDGMLCDIKIGDLGNITNTSSTTVTFDIPEGGGYTVKGMLMDKSKFPNPAIKTYSVLESGGSISNINYAKNTITLQAGKTASLNLLGTTGIFTNIDLTHRYTWTGGNSSVITVTPGGYITGVAAGETYVKSNDDTLPKLKVVVTD